MSITHKILSSPIYIKEKAEHAKYCNGEGEIIRYSSFYPYDTIVDRCPYCYRIEMAKEQREAKKISNTGSSNGKHESEAVFNLSE